MPQLDASTFLPQLFWLAILFGVLYAVVSIAVFPRLREVLEARQQRIQRDLDRAEELRLEAEEARSAYERNLAEAREKGDRHVREVVDKVAEDTRTRCERLEGDLAEELRTAEQRIADSRTRAWTEAREEATELVSVLVRTVSGIPVSDAEAREALARVEP